MQDIKTFHISAMLGDVLRVNSSQLGLSDAHFDVVTVNGKSDICACSLQIAQNTMPEEPSFCGFTFEDLKTKQAIDHTDLKIIIDWLGSGEVPDEGVVFLASPEANYYWLNKELFKLVDGVLFRQ